MLADKYKAQKNLLRTPEKALLGTALLGGSLGVYAGMRIARHKTLHVQFSIGVPVIMGLQVLLFVFFMSV